MADLIKQIKGTNGTIYDLQDKVSTFGGTNLLLMSSNPTLNSYNPPTYGNTSGGNGTPSIVTITDSPISNMTKAFQITGNTSGNKDFSQLIDSFKQIDSTNWVFSAYIKSLQSSSNLFIRIWDYTAGAQRFSSTRTWTYTTWTKFSVIINSSGLVKGNNNALLFGVTGSGAVQFLIPKLEKGIKPTEWTPAPQDLVTYASDTIEFFQ